MSLDGLRALLGSLVLLSAVSGGCATAMDPNTVPPSTTVPPKASGPVTIRVASVPPGAQELGPIHVTHARSSGFADAVKEVAAKTQALGGNYAKIDDIKLESGVVVDATRSYGVIGVVITGRAFRVEQP